MPIVSLNVSPSKVAAILGILVTLSAGIGGYYVLRSDVEELKQIVDIEGVRAFAFMQSDVKQHKLDMQELDRKSVV